MTTFSFPRRAALLALAGALGLLATTCTPDAPATPDYAALDEAALKDYIAAKQITNAQRQTSGLYFVPDSVNNNLPQLTPGQTLTVLYTGELLNGQVFDASSKHNNVPIKFTLGVGQVITGWDLGLALMHKGDKARLLLPSALGYGSSYAGTIPPNSPLVFTVRVLDAQ